MTTSIRTGTWALSGDAAWSAWCQAIYNVLTDVGWVNTADTGSTTLPVSSTYPLANTFSVWWVFRFNDTEQSTCPIYIKVELARGNGTANARIQITYGTGTDGAGTIRGSMLNTGATSIASTSWSPSVSATTEFRACMHQGAAWFVVMDDAATFFYIGRSLDAAGARTDKGYVLFSQMGPSSTGLCAVLHNGSRQIRGGSSQFMSGLYHAPVNLSAAIRTSSGGTAPIWPIKWRSEDGFIQYTGAYGANKTDIGGMAVMSVDQFSLGAKNYLMVSGGGGGAGTYPRGADVKAQQYAGLLLIWE